MTAMRAVGVLIACGLSLLLLCTAQRDRRRGTPWYVYSWGYAASLLWAVAAYITAMEV